MIISKDLFVVDTFQLMVVERERNERCVHEQGSYKICTFSRGWPISVHLTHLISQRRKTNLALLAGICNARDKTI